MAVNAAQLLVNIGANVGGAQAGITGIASMLGSKGMLALAAVGAGAAIAGIGVIATKMAGDFQAGLTTLVTGAGESQANLKLISSGLLQMARDTGTSTKELTDGLYMIESAGIHGGAALDVLKAAAEGAKVGNADLGTTADALTTILKDYPNVTDGASGAMNTLIATVANGKTHMQDLALALSQVLPTAQAAGVGLNDVMAAMAAQTAAGVPAADAATHLRQMLIALEAPSSAAKKALESVGLTTDQVAAAMHKSLPDALQMITEAVGKKFPAGSAEYLDAMKNISGGMRQMQGMLILTSKTGMADFQKDVGLITRQVQQGGHGIAGWNLVQKTFNQQVSRAAQVAETLMIQLGEKLLPVATRLFGFLADNAIPTIKNVTAFLSGNSAQSQIVRDTLIVLSIAIAGALVAAFIAWAVAAGAAAIATLAATWPILAVGAAIALLIAGIILLVQHWQQITAVVTDAVQRVTSAIGNFFGWLYNHNTIVKDFVDGIRFDFQEVGKFFATFGPTIKKALDVGLIKPFEADIALAESWGGELIKMFIKGLQASGAMLKQAAITVLGPLAKVLGFHSPAEEGPGRDADTWAPNLMRMYAAGIMSGAPGVAQAALGVAGTLAGALGAAGTLAGPGVGGGAPIGGSALYGAASVSAGGAQTLVVLQIDGRKLAQAILPYLPDVIRQATGARHM